MVQLLLGGRSIYQMKTLLQEQFYPLASPKGCIDCQVSPTVQSKIRGTVSPNTLWQSSQQLLIAISFSLAQCFSSYLSSRTSSSWIWSLREDMYLVLFSWLDIISMNALHLQHFRTLFNRSFPIPPDVLSHVDHGSLHHVRCWSLDYSIDCLCLLVYHFRSSLVDYFIEHYNHSQRTCLSAWLFSARSSELIESR